VRFNDGGDWARGVPRDRSRLRSCAPQTLGALVVGYSRNGFLSIPELVAESPDNGLATFGDATAEPDGILRALLATMGEERALRR